ncbi:MAG: hypothetical protein AB7S26_25285 [Sandaracinaceae bacterium]
MAPVEPRDDGGVHDGGLEGADAAMGDGGRRRRDAGEPADASDVDAASVPDVDAGPRTFAGFGVTSPEVLFEGTELDLSRQYGLYIQDSRGRIDVVPDPEGTRGDVIRFRHPKDSSWAHTMVRPTDARTGYRDAAQVRAYEAGYYYRQDMYVTADPDWDRLAMNLLEDFHCEPCEANTLQVMLNYDGRDSLCIWIAYSTDPAFDPRGHNRGSSFDPWPALSGPNRFVVPVGSDGAPSLPSSLPDTGALLLCRDDLHTSDLFDRWVTVEMMVRPSSYDSGVVAVSIDGHLYRYDGPNNYRYNQDRPDPLPVNTFQIGLYGEPVGPSGGAASYFEIYTTPPRIELGDDVL